MKRGPWSPEEDAKLKEYIDKYGTGGNWIALPQKAGIFNNILIVQCFMVEFYIHVQKASIDRVRYTF